MSDIIYKNREEAVLACKYASEEICQILDKYGVWQETGDDNLDAYLRTAYRDDNGEVRHLGWYY